MAVGIKKTRDFQVFYAGWNARHNFDHLRKEFNIPNNLDVAYLAYQTWVMNKKLASKKRKAVKP